MLSDFGVNMGNIFIGRMQYNETYCMWEPNRNECARNKLKVLYINNVLKYESFVLIVITQS